MDIADYCSTFVDKIVIKCEETTDQFIFQVIHNWALNSCQIEVDKQELIDAIQLIRKSRGADIIFKDPKIRLGYVAGYDDGKIDAEGEREREKQDE